MASLQKKGRSWFCQFKFGGKRHTFAVGRVSEDEARAKARNADYLLMRIEQGLVAVPDGTSVADFLKYDGKPPAHAPAAPVQKVRRDSGVASLAALRDGYLAAHDAALEASTLKLARTHFKHLAATLGEGFPLPTLSMLHLQGHVDRRTKTVSAATARKEIATLGTAWNWGRRTGLLSSPCPSKGLVYPKADEKPPFQTRAEIERQLDGLTPAQQGELWDCLYLTLPEVQSLLEYVREHASYGWIYPLVTTAAHTGMRRSELLRLRRSDVDFAAGIVTVRERKRVKGKRTTRRVPLSPQLAEILAAWLNEHPGGALLFCPPEEVGHSKKRSPTTGHQNKGRPTTVRARMATVRPRGRPGHLPLTRDEVRDHVERTLAGSPWAVLRGLHVLRHSFISACANKGLDQRLIDEWVGHQTEEQRKRYRHLYPSVQAEAMKSVFS